MEKPTKMVFRAYPDGEVIALMPEIPTDANGYYCGCYLHVGQHGDADYSHVISTTRPAHPDEFGALKHELESPPYGYRVQICKRESATMRENRKHAA